MGGEAEIEEEGMSWWWGWRMRRSKKSSRRGGQYIGDGVPECVYVGVGMCACWHLSQPDSP